MDVDDVDAIPLSDAANTLPTTLEIRESPGKGQGVFARNALSWTATPLGQYTGRVVTNAQALDPTNAYVFAVYGVNTCVRGVIRNKKTGPVYWIDSLNQSRYDATPMRIGAYTLSSDEQQSNWTRYINSINPGERRMQNVEYCELDGRIYIRLIKRVEVGDELLADYGEQYWMVAVDETCVLSTHVRDQSLVDRMRALLPASYRESPTLRLWVFSPMYRIAFLYERGRDADVGFIVTLQNTIIALRVIDVLNANVVRMRLVEAIDDVINTEGRLEMFASSTAFGLIDPNQFGFGRISTYHNNTMDTYYRRAVDAVTFRLANIADMDLLLGGDRLLAVACPNVARMLIANDFFPVNSKYDAQFEAIVVERRNAIVAMSVTRIIDHVLAVACILPSLTFAGDLVLERYVFMRFVEDYERSVNQKAPHRKQYVVFATEDTDQAKWLSERGYTRSKSRRKSMPIASVSSTLYYERTRPNRSPVSQITTTELRLRRR